MAAPITIRMTLTGALKGETVVLNGYQFIKGICDFTDSQDAIQGVTTYFTRSYQVEITKPKAKAKDEEPEPNSDPTTEAVGEDDEILALEGGEEDPLKDNIEEPNRRQAEIIAAVNQIDSDGWVDKHTTARPRVKDVAELMKDPTVTKREIVEVIKTWLL